MLELTTHVFIDQNKLSLFVIVIVVEKTRKGKFLGLKLKVKSLIVVYFLIIARLCVPYNIYYLVNKIV